MSVQYTVYSMQCTVYNVQYTVYNIQCTVHRVEYTVYSMQCTVYSVQYTVYSTQCRVYSVQYTLYAYPGNQYNRRHQSGEEQYAALDSSALQHQGQPRITYLYIIKLFAHIYIYIYMLLLAIDGQTAGPNWPNFFEKPMGTRAITLAKKIGKRRSLQLVYNLLAEGPCVARGRNKFKQKFDNKISNISAYDTPRSSMSVHINFSPIGSAVWPAIRNIYMSCFFYIDLNSKS